MHHVHQTNSQIYDYKGKEEQFASYLMADIDFGPKINILTGGRNESNKTTYFSNSTLDHALSHWIYVADTTEYTRENSISFLLFL